MEYFYPEYKLRIGSIVLTEGVTLEYLQDNELKIDWCEIILSEKLQGVVSANYEDLVVLDLGYNGVFTTVFSGYVTDIEQNKFKAKSKMLNVHKTEITNSFLDATPDEVFTYILTASGIEKFDIDVGVFPTKRILNISKMNGIKALKYVENAFSIKNLSYFFEDDILKLVISKTTSKVYEFVYGVNIKNLDKIDDKSHCLKTVCVPFISVLDTIKVTHLKVNGEFIVNKIVVNINESGFIETKLYFKV